MRNLLHAPGIALLLLSAGLALAQTDVPVFNGSFEQDTNGDGIPDGWSTAGRPGIEQQLSRITDPERGPAARLTCTRFLAGSPDSHVMLAQLDHVGVRSGQWYRLQLWARAENLESGVVQVSLVNRVVWHDVGLAESFVPRPAWERFEFSFRAAQDLRPEESRLQIWFTGTGTLDVADVVMEPVPEVRRQWHPQLPMTGLHNPLPNSGFECGGAGWGCWGGGSSGWGAEAFRLLGQWDSSRAFEGRHSWRISLSPQTLPICYFDYYEPVESALKVLLLGHQGWVPVQRGQSYVFSAYVMADRPDLGVRMVCRQVDGRPISRTFSVGEQWTRIQLAFTADTDFACGSVGLDLGQAARPEGTLWLDALQWEPGESPSPYHPSRSLEARVETDRLGNIFTDPKQGMAFHLRAFNAAETADMLCGTLTLTDYLDRPVWRQDVNAPIQPRQATQLDYDRVLGGRQGFFRLHWQPEAGPAHVIRLAVIEPSRESDSLFGMNHAFPWEFLLDLSHLAGLRNWRDWSAKWQTVQPQPGEFDFHVPDVQIGRVLDAGGQVLALLPFPSASWATQPDLEKIRKEAGQDPYLQQRLVVACKPSRLEDFAAYVRATVEHYRARIRVFEILNEPLYTNYAVPAAFGYGIDDYIALLQAAYKTAKAIDPACTIIGGIGSPPDSRWVDQFIKQGGLAWCDVMDLHLYPHRGSPDAYERAFATCWESVKAQGPVRPIWITEIGFYGEDDPPFTPFTVGDSSMNAALRPSELRASADLVKFTALLCAAGARKIFYHAGTCAALNDNDAGNIFFEYGGAPRKQYAAQAVLSRWLGPDVEFLGKRTSAAGIQAFEFRSRGRPVIIVWAQKTGGPALDIPQGYQGFDLMGNRLEGSQAVPGEAPMYWIGDR